MVHRHIHEGFFDLPVAMRVLVQLVAIISCATIGSFAVARLRFGSPWNLTWAALLPAVIGILLNKGTTNRVSFAAFWVMLSFATVLIAVGTAGLDLTRLMAAIGGKLTLL